VTARGWTVGGHGSPAASREEEEREERRGERRRKRRREKTRKWVFVSLEAIHRTPGTTLQLRGP
jgi:hypothetical protein